MSRFLPDIAKADPGWNRWKVALLALSVALVASGPLAIVTALFDRFRRWSSTNFLWYLLEVAAGLAVAASTRRLVQPFAEENFGLTFSFDIMGSPLLFFWGLLITLSVFSILHSSEKKIRHRLATATTLVQKLQDDRRELVRADEQIRDQIAQFLHDRVQAELMVLAMNLGSVSDKVDEQSALELSRVSSRLEKIRRIDLRVVGQILAPNLRSSGLTSAFESLAEQLGSGIVFEFQVDDSLVHSNEQLALGVYRIVEQSVVNSITHGPASSVLVSLAAADDSMIELSVTDDGPGSDQNNLVAGVGSAVIDSWVSILGGKKILSSAPQRGFQLTVMLPLTNHNRSEDTLAADPR